MVIKSWWIHTYTYNTLTYVYVHSIVSLYSCGIVCTFMFVFMMCPQIMVTTWWILYIYYIHVHTYIQSYTIVFMLHTYVHMYVRMCNNSMPVWRWTCMYIAIATGKYNDPCLMDSTSTVVSHLICQITNDIIMYRMYITVCLKLSVCTESQLNIARSLKYWLYTHIRYMWYYS